jgi:hypothetical protein
MHTATLPRMLILTIGLSAGTYAVADNTMTQFNDLDINHDGYIDRSEATSDALLRERWNSVDMDNNNKLNYQEFQRFEQAPDEPYPIPQ